MINAGAIGRDGEVLVLDMGEPVKIVDVARRFAEQHSPPLEIVFTGLREGEKLHEDLVADDEQGEATVHPMITFVAADSILLDPAEVQPTTADEMRALAAGSTQTTTI